MSEVKKLRLNPVFHVQNNVLDGFPPHWFEHLEEYGECLLDLGDLPGIEDVPVGQIVILVQGEKRVQAQRVALGKDLEDFVAELQYIGEDLM
jgi:hypothetical protein